MRRQGRHGALGTALVLLVCAAAAAAADGPVVAFDSGTESWSNVATRTIARSAVSGGPVATYETFVDGARVDASGSPSLEHTFSQGDHLVEVSGSRDDGVAGPRVSRRVRVDTTGPVLTASIPSHAYAGDAVALSVAATDALSGVVNGQAGARWRVDGQDAAAGFAATIAPSAGVHGVAVTVTDVAGNATVAAGTLVVVQRPTVAPPPILSPPDPDATLPRVTSTRRPRLRASARRSGRAVLVEGSVSPAVDGTVTLLLRGATGRPVRGSAPVSDGEFEARLALPRDASSATLRIELDPVAGVQAAAPLELRITGLDEDAGSDEDVPSGGGGSGLCANLRSGEQCGAGNGRRTAGGGEKVSHKGWPAITGVLWKVLDSGNHQRRGGPDNDELLGHHGSDRIWGHGGNDVLWGDWDPADNNTRQRDVLYGGAGNDWLYPSHGPSRVLGGPGNDRVWAFYGKGLIDCGPGRDTARVRMNGAFRLKGCENVQHFCAHGSDGHGGCRKPTAVRARRR